jgi:ankyrin repeat protein
LYVASFGNLEIAKKLLDQGANPNTKDNKGYTARTKARAVKNRQMQLLIKSRGGKG